MGEQLSILIIDDDELDRIAVRRALRAAGLGAEVAEVAGGAAAVELLTGRSFDCILLDYRLPPTDGLSVLRDLRGRGVDAPIVVLTGQGDERVAVELMKAGATDYLTKDALSPGIIGQSVRAAVRVHEAEMRAARVRAEALARTRFLADASRALSGSLDAGTLLAELGRLVVPALADWCAIDLLEPGGAMRRALCHPPAESSPWSSVVHAAWPPDAVTEVACSGAPVSRPQIDDRSDAPLILAVPLMLRGLPQGAISLARRPGSRPYDAGEIALADELAQRVAVAFENARLYEQAREAIRMRDEFLSIASHELRTPLTSLLGYVQILERRLVRSNDFAERDQRAMRVITEQVVRLNRMISALLDVSRLQSGQFALQLAPADLRSIAAHAVEELRTTLDKHRVILVGEEELPIEGDELRLHQVLQNLLQNAAKYSPAGGTIEVTLLREGDWATITVTDQGIGIPNEALPHLFDRFFRAANAEERRISGIGLGLYVVHEIVALHGGSVEVSSEVGEGSVFRVRLPLRHALAGLRSLSLAG